MERIDCKISKKTLCVFICLGTIVLLIVYNRMFARKLKEEEHSAKLNEQKGGVHTLDENDAFSYFSLNDNHKHISIHPSLSKNIKNINLNGSEYIRKKEEGCTHIHPCTFVMVADLDKRSLDEGEDEGENQNKKNNLQFKSYVFLGSIKEKEKEKKEEKEKKKEEKEKKKYLIEFEKKEIKITSALNEGGRGMELSEIIVFNQKLLTFDDRTGIVFEIFEKTKNKGENGNGNFSSSSSSSSSPPPSSSSSSSFSSPFSSSFIFEVSALFILQESEGSVKGMKIEWAAKKQQKLFVGSFGKEFVDEKGRVLHRHNMWVCAIDRNGQVERHDWSYNYNQIRKALGAEYPNGYVIHEAVNWSSLNNKWVFLPRRVSHEPYDEKSDEEKGSNLIVLCDEDFEKIEVVEIQTKNKMHNRRGFSSFKFIPGTKQQEIMALKTEEDEEKGIQKTYVTIFTLSGEVLLEDLEIPTHFKYEGIEFI